MDTVTVQVLKGMTPSVTHLTRDIQTQASQKRPAGIGPLSAAWWWHLSLAFQLNILQFSETGGTAMSYHLRSDGFQQPGPFI